eukprot:364195-Chlamydomonas_euryale.AAC.18
MGGRGDVKDVPNSGPAPAMLRFSDLEVGPTVAGKWVGRGRIKACRDVEGVSHVMGWTWAERCLVAQTLQVWTWLDGCLALEAWWMVPLRVPHCWRRLCGANVGEGDGGHRGGPRGCQVAGLVLLAPVASLARTRCAVSSSRSRCCSNALACCSARPSHHEHACSTHAHAAQRWTFGADSPASTRHANLKQVHLCVPWLRRLLGDWMAPLISPPHPISPPHLISPPHPISPLTLRQPSTPHQPPHTPPAHARTNVRAWSSSSALVESSLKPLATP